MPALRKTLCAIRRVCRLPSKEGTAMLRSAPTETGRECAQENMAEKEVRYHPTQKPTALMEWCIGHTEAKTILDPWMGSGTTLIAARAKGLKADGIEINEQYCEAAKQRLSQGVLLAV